MIAEKKVNFTTKKQKKNLEKIAKKFLAIMIVAELWLKS
jgi:hypothetical protein